MVFFLENYLGHPAKNAVITVPAYFNDSQRQVRLLKLGLPLPCSWLTMDYVHQGCTSNNFSHASLQGDLGGQERQCRKNVTLALIMPMASSVGFVCRKMCWNWSICVNLWWLTCWLLPPPPQGYERCWADCRIECFESDQRADGGSTGLWSRQGGGQNVSMDSSHGIKDATYRVCDCAPPTFWKFGLPEYLLAGHISVVAPGPLLE